MNTALPLPSQKNTCTVVNVAPSTAVDNDAGNKQRHLNWTMLQHVMIGKAHQCICISCSNAYTMRTKCHWSGLFGRPQHGLMMMGTRQESLPVP